VFQEEGKRILDEFGISAKEYSVGYYIADALETISTLLTVICKVAVDATGHDAEVCHIVVRKIGPKLRTKTGEVMGEKPMWAEKGEKEILKNTTEVYPGLVVAGMTANAVLGSPRMWAIFGGMLLSGKKAARVAMKLLKEG
jgi:thiamine thiazole synthase